MLSAPDNTVPQPSSAALRPRGARFFERWGSTLEWLVRLRGSPDEIARGVAVGIFVALTPTVGFQIAIAAFLATLLNANRSLAIVGVWITNPFTIAPIFAFTYAVGIKFWPGPSLSGVGTAVSRAADQVAVHGVWELGVQLQAILHLGADMLGPLAIGGTIAGIAGGALAYAVTAPLVRSARRRRLERLVRNAERRARANGLSGSRTLRAWA